MKRFTFGDRIVAAAFVLFTISYIAMIFYKADFALYDDNEILTDYSVVGKPYPPPIYVPLGRFYPLAFQEFNALSHVTRSIRGYELVPVIELIVLLIAFYFTLDEIPIRFRFLALAVLMLTPSFVASFTGLIFPERDILFWLTIILLCLRRYAATNGHMYFVGCLVALHFAAYYKEPVVVMIVVFAISRVLLQVHKEREQGRPSWRRIVKNNALFLGMLGVSGIYAVLIFFALLPRGTPKYAVQQSGRFDGLGTVLQPLLQWQVLADWLPLLLLAVLIARFIFLGSRLDLLLDPLAAGALAYYFIIIALRIGNAWYTAPVDFIAVFYLASNLTAWLKRTSKLRISIVVLVLLTLVAHDVLYSSFLIVERKSVITAKMRFADFLRAYLSTVKGDNLELFFPYSYEYDLMGLSAFLRHEGFQLEEPFGYSQANAGPQSIRLVIQGRRDFVENKCVPYRDYVCRHADAARPGAMIVVLPDDDASMADVQHLRENAKPMFSFKGPDFCTRNNSWFRSLHAMSRTYPRSRLPEHWLQLDVFRSP